jgi:hypothetical protein
MQRGGLTLHVRQHPDHSADGCSNDEQKNSAQCQSYNALLLRLWPGDAKAVHEGLHQKIQQSHFIFTCILGLNRLPPARLPREENRFDHRHILDGVLQRHRRLAAVAQGFRKNVTLNRVLVADREGLDRDATTH